ncbi:MAG: hypothetical protein EHM78_07285, partial [Myxococcaceae bacterium]
MGFEDRPEWRLLVALGVGLVLGLERERARDAERPRRWAGLRSFGLTSLLGGVALQTGSAVVLGVAGATVALLALVVAWRAKEPDPGLTTEAGSGARLRPGGPVPARAGPGPRRRAGHLRAGHLRAARAPCPTARARPEALQRPRAAERAGPRRLGAPRPAAPARSPGGPVRGRQPLRRVEAGGGGHGRGRPRRARPAHRP